MEREFSDVTAECQKCGGQFVFTAGEQELLSLRGIKPQPASCPDCNRRLGYR